MESRETAASKLGKGKRRRRKRKGSYVGVSLVEDDLDRVAWRSLNDPFTVKGLLIEFWPAGGEDDPTGSLQISSTWG